MLNNAYCRDSRLQDSRILSNTLLQFRNCKLVRNGELVAHDLWVENGKIVNPEPIFFLEKRPADIEVDCKGSVLAPGFIDTQINGVHLEGPFISQEKRGAHPPQNLIFGIAEGCQKAIDQLISVYGPDFLNVTAMITLAPELPNMVPLISELVEKCGIKVSLGHSTASVLEGENGVRAGASGITHLFNAMTPFHHRDPGLVGLLASKCLPNDRTLFYGVIADGIHTHDAALKIAHRTHPQGMILVTDAMAALGLRDGTHSMGDVTMEVEDNKAVIVGTQTLAGSVSSMDFCVRHLVEAARCSPIEALEAASLHPAQFLNILDRKGTLNYGSDADFVLLDDDLHPKATFIGGQMLWNKDIFTKHLN